MYTYTLTTRDGGRDVELQTETLPYTLRDTERFALLRANEWLASGVAADATLEVRNAAGKLVRTHAIYTATKGRNVGRVVMERL